MIKKSCEQHIDPRNVFTVLKITCIPSLALSSRDIREWNPAKLGKLLRIVLEHSHLNQVPKILRRTLPDRHKDAALLLQPPNYAVKRMYGYKSFQLYLDIFSMIFICTFQTFLRVSASNIPRNYKVCEWSPCPFCEYAVSFEVYFVLM